MDLDGNGLYDDADAYADNDNLQQAVTDWALDADDVLIFITDHGGDGNFRINETELLQAVDFDQWVDELQEVIPGRVTIVYDACHSGSFLSALTPPEGKKRIVIASTKSDQEAYFTSFGDLSFSSFFWQHIINGMNVFDAFVIAKNSIEYTYSRQMPQLDDNGTGVGNESTDGELAQEAFIGTGLISGGGIPVIDGVSPTQTLMEEETSAVLYAENVIDSDGIERVWAVITPPDFDPGDTEKPVLEMPVVEMVHVGGNRYQGIYNEFTLTGTYNVAVYAKDVLGGIVVPSQTTVVKRSNETSPATFDAAGLLTIPCLDLQGTGFSLKLFLTSYDTLSFQMTDIHQVDVCSPCAVFNMETSVLHIDNLDLGASYWADLTLTGTDPVVFSLSNLEPNE
ncbi:MAG: C13 family peptidase [Thermodesulfobacteriota bacterium]|nr:C13 family peptidase [Thermodesulfobacteriota bacterium]